jgi:PhnB protein
MADVSPVPVDYPRVIPYLSVEGADAAIAFYTSAFGFEERVRMDGPEGKVVHAELGLGNALVMLADTFPDMGGRSPQQVGGTPVGLMVYVEDVDATHRRALDGGATEMRAPEDQFYGDRTAQVRDPFGHEWFLATRIEDVSDEEMAKRVAAFTG